MNNPDESELPPLVLMGDPRLSQPSAPVDPTEISTPAFQERLRVLKVGLKEHCANGIAAPQLGWFQRFLLMRDPSSKALVYWINPEVTTTTAEHHWAWEGCLSVPGFKAYIGRPAAVAVHGLDAQGTPLHREFRGWEAHLFQHEFDHLDGVLFPYRAGDPRHVVRVEEFAQRATWPKDWPAPGARDAEVRDFPEGEDAYFGE
mgnify:CR=1 FL=1